MLDVAEAYLPEILRLNARWRGSAAAVVAPEGARSWAELDAGLNRVANGLYALGLNKGDRVGLVMSNGLAAFEAMFGVVKAGMAVVPLNPSVTDEALAAMLADAGVRAVIATADHAGRLQSTAHLGPEVRLCAGIDGAATPPGWRDYDAWLAAQPATDPQVAIGPDDLCNIIYSSGTTGLPKGIVHTHGARRAWVEALAQALRYHAGARTLIVTGLYSNISWVGLLCTLTLGGTIFVRRAFDPGDFLATVARERITHLSMVPVQFQRVLEHPGFADADHASLHAMMCCGSPLPVGVKARLFEAFACGVIELYGTTEGVITTLQPEDAPGRLETVGRPTPGAELRILGPDDRPVADGEAGEIVMRTRYAMAGYWNRPEATEEATWRDEQGRRWLRSGDVGRLDADGFLQVVDRKKDMILSGGQNVYPADIEAVLASHPDVAEVAVIGVPHPTWGETPLALVVRRAGRGKAAEGELQAWLNARLGRQQRVQAVEFRAELPRNANGKVLKRELRAPYWAG